MENIFKITHNEETKEVSVKMEKNPFINKSFITSDGKYILSSGFSGGIFRWDLEHIEKMCLLPSDSMTFGISASPNGKYCAAGTLNGTTTLWDIAEAKELNTFECGSGDLDVHNAGILALSDKHIVKRCSKSVVKIYELFSGKAYREFTWGDHDIRGLLFSLDGKYVALMSEGCVTLLWDIEKDKIVFTIPKDDISTSSVSFTPDSRSLVVSDKNDVTRLFDVKDGSVSLRLTDYDSFTFSADGKYIFIGTFLNTIVMHALEDRKKIQDFEGHDTSTASLYATKDGKYLVSRSSEYIVMLWDVKSGKALRTFKEKSCGKISLATTAEGKNFLVDSENQGYKNNARVHDLEESEIMYDLNIKERDKNDLSGMSNTLVTPEWMRTLWLWADKYDIPAADLPRDSEHLLALEEFSFAKDFEIGFKEIPEELGMLSNLTYLGMEVFGDDVIVIPESLGNLSNLTHLHLGLYCSDAIIVPESLDKLTNLIDLHLGLNGKGGTIPQSLSNLTQIKYLSLSGDIAQNDVDVLLQSYENLSELTISDNETIRSLPDNICEGEALGKLMLRYNNNLLLSDQQFKYGTDLRTKGGDREDTYCNLAGCFTLQFGKCFEYYCFIPSGE